MKESSCTFIQTPSSARWSWPLDLDRYDKDPHIQPLEYAELEKRFQNGKQGHIYPHTLQLLHRFAEPILDVLSYIDAKPETYHQTLRAMLLEMYRRGKTFWACLLKNGKKVFAKTITSFASGTDAWEREHVRAGIFLYWPICSKSILRWNGSSNNLRSSRLPVTSLAKRRWHVR